jgi:single-stranded DNA-binding protein
MEQKVKGISHNESTFIGRVAEDPQITDTAAFFKLKTTIVEQGANNQFVEALQEVPCLTMDKNKIKTVASYIKKGKQLLIKGYYKSWVDGNGALQHAFIITLISLGPDENYKPNSQGQRSGGSGSFPSFPG